MIVVVHWLFRWIEIEIMLGDQNFMEKKVIRKLLIINVSIIAIVEVIGTNSIKNIRIEL